MIPYQRLLQRVFNTPLYCMPQNARIIGDYLLRRSAGLEAPRPHSCDMCEDDEPRSTSGNGLYDVVDGVAIIRIVGELVNRGEWIGADSGLVSYEGIKRQCAAAETDGRVEAVVVDCDSPGGEAIGMADAAAAMRRLAAVKPVHFYVNGLCASAMYGLASAGTKIIIGPDSIAGSIGTYLMHVDISKALERDGVKITLIHEGEHKVDGNPYEELPDDVRGDLQTSVKQFYDLFVATVAEGRKGLSEEAIRATGARTYIGQQAVDAGLADAVGTFEEVLAALVSENQQGAPALRNEGGPLASVAVHQEENDMKRSTIKAALSAIGLGELAGMMADDPSPTPEEQPKEGAPSQKCAKCEQDDCDGGEDCPDKPEEKAQAETPAESAASAASSLVHHGILSEKDPNVTLYACGGTDIVPGQPQSGSAALEEINCSGCLKALLAQRDTQAKQDAEAARLSQIENDTKAFEAKCSNLGQDGTKALVARYVAARKANDTAAVADCEAIAASVHLPGPTSRIEGAEDGPSADKIAARVKGLSPEEVGPEAARRVKARGITERSPKWKSEYSAEVARVRAEMGTGVTRGA